ENGRSDPRFALAVARGVGHHAGDGNPRRTRRHARRAGVGDCGWKDFGVNKGQREDKRVKIYLDGKYVSADEAKISVFDHGLLYGDGVFEGIRLYNGRIFRLEQHLKRLFASAKAIMLQVPLTKEQLVEACCET